MTFTKEQLQQIIDTDHVQCGDAAAMARQLLASMEKEPEGWQFLGVNGLWVSVTENGMRQALKEGCEVRPLYAAPQLPQPAVPDGLNPQTTDLVLRFSNALAEKLYKAERKYGRSTDWMRKDWYNDCLQSLWEHIEKGDPRDVAAYCAFMWHHGWVTTDYDRNVHNACRAAMLQGADGNAPAHFRSRPAQSSLSPAQGGNSPVIPDCSCGTCRPVTFTDSRFVVCSECGNKRCPHANDHRNACTGSNEPGQEGRAYPAAPQQE